MVGKDDNFQRFIPSFACVRAYFHAETANSHTVVDILLDILF